METATLTVCMDQNSHEHLYVDGQTWGWQGECTVYACDLVEAAAGKPILLTIRDFVSQEGATWPPTLAELEASPKFVETTP